MAIKEAGNVIKRFLSSEFGSDPERVHPVDPATTLYAGKISLRRLIEAEGIPHTYVCWNGFAETYLVSIGDVTAVGTGPPSDKTTVLGDGDANGVFVVEEDIAAYTVRAIDDTRTLNKIMYMRPPVNIVSHNELIALWEKKAGRTFQIARIPEADLLKLIKGRVHPSLGDQANFDIEPSFGVEATELYPDVKYTTVDEYLDRLL
ncbi:hypothetical protein VPH35_041785 [Triticum aestivum]